MSLLSGCLHYCDIVCVALCKTLLHWVPAVAKEAITTCKYSVNKEIEQDYMDME